MINKKIFKERVFLATPQSKQKGTVSLEAALAISTFMMIVISVAGFVILLISEFSMMRNINNLSMESAKAKFYIEKGLDNSSEQINKLSTAYLSARIYADKNLITSKTIKGVNTLKSKMDDGKIDIVVSYKVLLPFSKFKFSVMQRALTKDWTGQDLTEEIDEVYITKNGKVYHTTKECRHLVISISKTTVYEVDNLRNENGGKYSPCSFCIKSKLSGNTRIFITTDGSRYHSTLQCAGLTRNIIVIDRSDIGDIPPCSECG